MALGSLFRIVPGVGSHHLGVHGFAPAMKELPQFGGFFRQLRGEIVVFAEVVLEVE